MNYPTEKELWAVIAYGCESMRFTKNGWGENDDKTAKRLTNPELNETSHQSEHAINILKLFNDLLLTDKQ